MIARRIVLVACITGPRRPHGTLKKPSQCCTLEVSATTVVLNNRAVVAISRWLRARGVGSGSRASTSTYVIFHMGDQ